MPHRIGDTYITHAGWRLAKPDNQAEQLLFPKDCPGGLVIEDIIGKDLLCLHCDQCNYQVSTRESRRVDPDSRTESATAREGVPL